LIEGIGVDIVGVERISAIYNKHGRRFLQKIFSPREIEYCCNRRNPPEHLAARFAAREALAKALPADNRPGWKQVEIISGKEGPEFRVLSPDWKPPGRIKVSLSHERQWAVALVIIYKEVGAIETGYR